MGVSVRGLVTILVVLTICVLSALKIEIQEPLYSLGALVVGFYFGQKTMTKGVKDENKITG